MDFYFFFFFNMECFMKFCVILVLGPCQSSPYCSNYVLWKWTSWTCVLVHRLSCSSQGQANRSSLVCSWFEQKRKPNRHAGNSPGRLSRLFKCKSRRGEVSKQFCFLVFRTGLWTFRSFLQKLFLIILMLTEAFWYKFWRPTKHKYRSMSVEVIISIFKSLWTK